MRRFLLDRPPPGDPGPETVIRQVFWRLGDGWTLRLRREGGPDETPRDSLTLTGPDDARWGWPLPPDPVHVAALFRAGASARTIAVRRSYRIDGRTWTVDEYHWEHQGLLVAATEAAGPVPPWCRREVTGDRAYDDDNLAFGGLPAR